MVLGGWLRMVSDGFGWFAVLVVTNKEDVESICARVTKCQSRYVAKAEG